ncbi:MAG: PDZ domain-containing protein [bacterium]
MGDCIVSINNKPINNQLPFLYQLYTYVPGDHISLGIIRNGQELTFNVVLRGMPQ